MASHTLKSTGVSSTTVYAASGLSIILSILIWVMKRDDNHANAERFGIFVGLWAPTLAIAGKVLEDRERASA